jgi:hypothetical protein
VAARRSTTVPIATSALARGSSTEPSPVLAMFVLEWLYDEHVRAN